MALFTKKTNNIPETVNRQVDGAEIWVVSWTALYGGYLSNPTLVSDKRVAKAFLSEKDALDFKKSLENAMNLLQCDFKINIIIEKQK